MTKIPVFHPVSEADYETTNDYIKTYYNPQGLAYADNVQDHSTLEAIDRLTGNRGILAASFGTHQGTYEPLFVRFVFRAANDNSRWLRVTFENPPKPDKYVLAWSTDLSLRTGYTIVFTASTLQAIRAKIADWRKNNQYWKPASPDNPQYAGYGTIEPITNNGHKPFTFTAAGLKAYPIKVLAKRVIQGQKTNYLFLRRVS